MQTLPELHPNSESQKCEINAKVAPQRISRSKDELAYWKAAIRQIPDSPYWYAEIQRGGIRRKVSLETSNRAAAAHRAREIWYFIRAHGWPAYLAKFKPESLAQADPTIGVFIAQVEKTADLTPKTLKSYVSALRKITSDIFGYSNSSKFGHGRGHKAWLERIHAVRLSELTPTAIQTWKRDFLACAGQDPLSQRSAKVSVNSFLRCARSLFASKILKHLKLELPDPLPFAGCQFEPKPSCKYRSTFDINALIGAARDELASSDVEAFKVFLLGTFAGLRRKEIDLLEWSSFRWDQGVISITPTAHFSAKSEDSYADVAIDHEMAQLFRGYQARATGPFVIESQGELRPAALYDYYRCGEIFDRLIGWLRSHGVQTLKPLHTLRKEFGSMICAAHGIHSASRMLRHSAVAVTDQFYSDHRVRATVGLGHLLESPKIVEFKQEVA
jgi:predicted metal-binding protein